MTLSLRRAGPDDSPQVGTLLRRLNRRVRAYTIYGCAGLDAYLRDVLRQGPDDSGSLFLVACDADRIVGVGEWRLLPDHLFWNQHYLLPAYRRQQLGRRLLLEALRHTRDQGYDRIRLDAFVDNAASRRWIRALGCVPVAEKRWVTAPLPPPPGAAAFTVPDLPQADRLHARYGFSRFELKSGARAYRIGRLGEAFFRATDLAILADAAALAALATLDPDRALLCIGLGRPPEAGLSTTEIARSIHFEGAVDAVLNHLRQALAIAP